MTTYPYRVVVSGSVKKAMPGAQMIGDAPDEEHMDVTVRVRRRQELPPLLPGMAEQQMSIEEYEANYGADPEDLRRVEEFAGQHDLKVEVASIARQSLILSGTVAAFKQAFGVDLKLYRHSDVSYRGRTGAIYVPAELKQIVTGVFGLDDRPCARPHCRIGVHNRQNGSLKSFLAHSAGFFPTAIAGLYNFPARVTGRGQAIGIIELGGGFRHEELKTYFDNLGIPTPDITIADFPGSGGNRPGTDPLDPTNADVEVMLSLQVAGAVASGARIVIYFAPDAQDQSFLDAITAAVADKINRPSILSIGWGGPESSATQQFLDNFNQVLQTAAHLGITVCVAAGDNASDGIAADDPDRDGHPHVDFPASSPFALACGGTLIRVSDNTIASETVWRSVPNEGRGGVSRHFPLPDYQVGVDVRNAVTAAGSKMRGVPDVAGNAAQESGYRVLCDGQWFPDSVKGVPPVGGTSAVAPLWTGLIALINGSLERRIGFINPLLYKLAPGCGAFRDITQGGNGRYQAGLGWDACTGLGTPDGQKLLDALRKWL